MILWNSINRSLYSVIFSRGPMLTNCYRRERQKASDYYETDRTESKPGTVNPNIVPMDLSKFTLLRYFDSLD